MNLLLIGIGVILLIGIVINLYLQLTKGAAPSGQRDWTMDIARLETEKKELEKDLDMEKKEKNELSGKGKQLYDQYKNLESEYKSILRERDDLHKKITQFESKKERNEQEQRMSIEKLQTAELSLKDERQRVIREEEERRRKTDEERDRVWNDHENAVISYLTDLCKLPQLQFRSYSNTQLPDDFDGSLKPDFLIEFLGQYVIFDAKASKAQSLQTYIDDNVKKTEEKIKKNKKIYPHVFLVVPSEAIGELKKFIIPKGEYTFYIISREAIAPILASLKRISTYELAEKIDPQKRENIINMIAELSTHILYRNAHELILTKMGADTVERIAHIDPDIATEMEQKNLEKKMTQLAPSEIKRLVASLTEQHLAMQQLAQPKASVKKSMIDVAQTTMQELL